MITLFRRIREKLIISGSLTKYLLYAIGEILLVVIGILIALQVNNWNEERQIRNREQASLIKLFQESSEIVLYYRNEVAWIQEFINNIDSTAKALHDGTYDKLDPDETSIFVGLYPTSWPPRTVYDELVNSGLFQEISSDTVRESVIDYYQSLAFFEGQLSYFRDNVEVPQDHAGSALRIVYDESNSRRTRYEFDLESLSKNEEFMESLVTGLRDIIQFQNFRVYTLEDAIKMCRVLATEIQTKCTAADQEITDPSPNVRIN